MQFPLTLTQAYNPVIDQSLEEGLAASLGLSENKVHVTHSNKVQINGLAVGDETSRHRQLLRQLVVNINSSPGNTTITNITFSIESAPGDVQVEALKASIVEAATEGSIVANIQQIASEKGALTPAMRGMERVLMAPTLSKWTQTVVDFQMVRQNTDMPTKALTAAPTAAPTATPTAIPSMALTQAPLQRAVHRHTAAFEFLGIVAVVLIAIYCLRVVAKRIPQKWWCRWRTSAVDVDVDVTTRGRERCESSEGGIILAGVGDEFYLQAFNAVDTQRRGYIEVGQQVTTLVCCLGLSDQDDDPYGRTPQKMIAALDIAGNNRIEKGVFLRFCRDGGLEQQINECAAREPKKPQGQIWSGGGRGCRGARNKTAPAPCTFTAAPTPPNTDTGHLWISNATAISARTRLAGYTGLAGGLAGGSILLPPLDMAPTPSSILSILPNTILSTTAPLRMMPTDDRAPITQLDRMEQQLIAERKQWERENAQGILDQATFNSMCIAQDHDLRDLKAIRRRQQIASIPTASLHRKEQTVPALISSGASLMEAEPRAAGAAPEGAVPPPQPGGDTSHSL
jgi:hypothetical protein